MIIYDKLKSALIGNVGKLYLKVSSISDLVYIRKYEEYEGFEYRTCKEVTKKNIEEVQRMFEFLEKKRERISFTILKDDEIIGKITLFNYNNRNNSIEIGYYIINKYRNKGYFTKSLRHTLNILFKDVKLNKVHAQTGAFNNNSILVLEKHKFKRDAILREHHVLNGIFYDSYIYSLLRVEQNTQKKTKN